MTVTAADPSAVRRGATLLAAGAVPFAAGGLLFDAPRAGEGLVLCPFRAVTELPCPLCGSTRAVALAARGDGAFLDFNAVAVAVLAGVALYGAAILALALRGGRAPAFPLRGRSLAAGVVAVAALAWAWALAHRDTIVA